MNIPAYRKNGLGKVYIAVCAATAAGAVTGFAFSAILTAISIILFVLAAEETVSYYMTDKTPVVRTNSGTLIINGKFELSPDDIIDVDFKKCLPKSRMLSFGAVLLTTASKTYRVRFVDDAESAANRIKGIIYSQKRKSRRISAVSRKRRLWRF